MAYDRLAQLDVFRLTDKASPGLVVRVRRPGLDAQLALAEAMPVIRRFGGSEPGIAELRAIRKLGRALADSVVDWSLELDGGPAPVSVRSLGRMDWLFVVRLVQGWLAAIEQQRAPAPDVPAEPTSEPEVDEFDEFAERLASLPTRPLPANAGEVAASA